MNHVYKYLACAISGLLVISGVAVAADKDLVVFDWSGYEDPNFFQSYIKQHGDSPTFAYFADEEEAFQKIRAGFRADLAHPCSQSVVKWRESGIIEPIDTSRLKNWSKVISNFRNMEGFYAEGKQWVVPVDWGSTAMTYRTDKVSKADASTLRSFVDPKYMGRVSIGDNVDDAYALGYLAIGITDWNKSTDADFKAASNFLREVHKNVRTYWQDGAGLRQLMASGEVLIAWAWNETATTMSAEGHLVAMKRDTAEGSSTWVCGYVNMVNGPGSEDKLYDFLDSWLEDKTAEYLVTQWGYGHSNGVAMNSLGAETLAGLGFGSIESYSKNTLWQAPVNSKLREKMIKEFELIKAGF
ncbi:MAG: extracellular solute-binding protein [Deltaproteobacteria bacterium]|jgi:spermidine/putrescine transport system substrate-binding protein|nr:extracellular solute-binding protein [Deltaproteobacteria bacterium]MBT4068241.1 extracellular solute-binding protein [Candidatus Neomarinimicrobiota bacterium]MBT5177096.1 extracellular solute-binding protein [Candidatus Neomarinimicrobiota bacterium]